MKWQRAWIALGSNLGNRRAAIESALQQLSARDDVRVLAMSTIVETAAVGPGLQPAYLNGAVAVETTLSPRRLLDFLLEIERSLGRDRTQGPRWGPRTIDLDLLLFEDAIIDEPGLTVPHPRMQERRFVLQPLAEIAPGVVHPRLGVMVRQMLEALPAAENCRRR